METDKNNSQIKDNNRNSSILEIIKWLIGTIGLGLTGICINLNIQNTNLNIKRLEADANFLSVVTKDMESRADTTELGYLKYVRTFITSPEIKIGIKSRIIEISNHLNETAAKKAKVITENQESNIIKDLKPKEKEELLKIKEEENSIAENDNQLSLEVMKNKEYPIVGNKLEVESISIISLNKVKKFTTPISISTNEVTYTLLGRPNTKWCKKGYYIQFNNTLRLGIKSLANRSIVFNLKDIEGENKDGPELIKYNSSVTLTEGGIHTVNHKDYRYEITLNYIGAAGKNPFTKAAYLTVSTYKKTANKK